MPDLDARGLSVLPYVPELLQSWHPTHGDDRHIQVDGSLAFVDISGFTKLTERLARKGNVGAEGADLVTWGGDAVLLLFAGTGHASRACRAVHDMRATLRRVGTLATTSATVTVRMSVGVHSGWRPWPRVGRSPPAAPPLSGSATTGCTPRTTAPAGPRTSLTPGSR